MRHIAATKYSAMPITVVYPCPMKTCFSQFSVTLDISIAKHSIPHTPAHSSHDNNILEFTAAVVEPQQFQHVSNISTKYAITFPNQIGVELMLLGPKSRSHHTTDQLLFRYSPRHITNLFVQIIHCLAKRIK